MMRLVFMMVFIVVGIVFGFLISVPTGLLIKNFLPWFCLSGGDLGSCGGTQIYAQWGLAFLGGIAGLKLTDHFFKPKTR